MSQSSFNPDWSHLLFDPFSTLGVSVTADDSRVLKRYRTVARLLHPDTYIQADPAVRDRASQLFARLVNPAYQKLRQPQGRADNLATLRFRVWQMSREEPYNSPSAIAQQLLKTAPAEINVVYEQAIAQLANIQYSQLDQLEAVTFQLAELNLVYLRLIIGEIMIEDTHSESVAESRDRPVQNTNPSIDTEASSKNKAEHHFLKAQEYMSHSNWNLAVRELRDAIRIDPNQSEYHAYLGRAYLMQDLPVMAKVHFRRALRLNPRNAIALYYASRLNLDTDESSQKKDDSDDDGLMPLFIRRRFPRKPDSGFGGGSFADDFKPLP